MDAIVEINDLYKEFGQLRVIDGLSFTVDAGDFFAIVGPNDSGKTSLLRMILGLLRSDSGNIRLFGQKVGSNQKDLLDRIGYLAYDPVYYPSMKVWQVLDLAAEAYGGVDGAEQDRLCLLFDIDREEHYEDLDWQDRRKLGLVIALQHDPELLILDQPMDSFSPEMVDVLWQELVARNDRGVTVVLTANSFQDLQKYCRTAILIRNGRSLVEGPIGYVMSATAKRIVLHGLNHLPILPGEIRDAQLYNNSVSFLYQGSNESLLQALNVYRDQIIDLEISLPTMTEVFYYYYDRRMDFETEYMDQAQDSNSQEIELTGSDLPPSHSDQDKEEIESEDLYDEFETKIVDFEFLEASFEALTEDEEGDNDPV